MIGELIDGIEWNVKHAITRIKTPHGIYSLLDKIHKRYANVDLNGNDWPQQKDEKLSKLISMINQDADMPRLILMQSPLPFGEYIHELEIGEKTGIGGFGVDLCIGKNGLYINDFNTYESREDKLPVDVETVNRYDSEMSAEKLKQAVMDYTERKNYITRRTWLKQMRDATPSFIRYG